MAGDTRLASILELTIVLISCIFIDETHGNYCRPDWCNYNEYCCGFDECCSDLTGYWYLWLMGGVVIFSFLFVFCWMRYRSRQKSHEHQKLHGQPTSYVMYGVTDYGEPIYIHQQPTGHHYGQTPTQGQYISTGTKGTFPLLEATQQQSSPVQPPPYDYTERRTPSAPPLGQ